MSGHDYGKWLSRPPKGEEVVITGVSGRLPESNNIYEFRDNLFSKKDMVTSDDRRWLLNHSEIPQRNAKIFDIDQFDPGFFGIHYRQADNLDPMARKFLETSIEAIMDAGVNPSELEGSKTGVFVGTCFSETEVENLLKITEPQKMGITGTLKSFIPNRISYYLKLNGPSYVVDTACSSSSYAIEHALKAIRTGECDNAIVGGVNIIIHPGLTLQFYRSGMLSSDGKCKVFDQDANGYVRGEAIASIFLQKRKNAKRVYAQILYAKINFDGFKPLGITFPSSQMQKQLITEVFEDSGLTPSDLNFLEAHGTGTQVGDPEEVEAIDGAIAKKREKPLLVGSVKSNIGHTEPVSALCSLIKVIIAMEMGRIPPNIHLKKIKEGMVGFEEGRMKVVTETIDLEGDNAIIGINNFGFGGSNCHLVVGRFNKKKINGELSDNDVPRLVCVSGRSENAVLTLLNDVDRKPLDSEYVGLLQELFKNNVHNHIYRGYTIISKNGPLKTSVRFYNGETSPLYIYFGNFEVNYKYLLKYLLNFPVFKITMNRIDEYLLLKNISIMNTLTKNEDKLGAFGVQLGIVDILHSLNLVPNAVFGDNLGKLVRDYYYNSITLEEAIQTAYHILESSIEVSNLETSIDKRSRYLWKSRGNLHKGTNSFEGRETKKNAIILNVSESSVSKNELLFLQSTSVTFLETLGIVYESGHNLHLHRLYPKIEYPVSRGTPMISPMIKWNYRNSWFTYKFKSFTFSGATQKEYKYSHMSEENKFLSGHVIDGRNLFPATGYLQIVWQTFIESRRLPTDSEVVFENCKFLRAVAMGQKKDVLSLSVFIQIGSGEFEVVDNNSLVVTGRIYAPQNVNLRKVDLARFPVIEKSNLVLEQDEIYRELYLRGYNYSDMFKGLLKCNVEADAGLVKWEKNWITFMDNMLQLKILQMDTRLLYVPTGIKKIVIEPSKFSTVTGDAEECVVDIYKELDIIKTTGIEISGLQATAISRKKSRLEPVLENYEFVPNTTHLSLEESLRVNIQIILENSRENNFKAVEILDDFGEQTLLLPLINEALEDVPLITPDLTISTKTTLEQMPSVKVTDLLLTAESGLLLIIGTKILKRNAVAPLWKALSKNGFILTREEIDFVPREVQGIDIVSQHDIRNERLILFKKSEDVTSTKFVEISETHLEWLSNLQHSLKYESNIVVYSYNQEFTGVIGLVNCIRREPDGNRVKCFFMMGKAPEFHPQSSFYKDQIKKNLAVNVYKNGQWGTYRHLLLESMEEEESEHCYVNTTVKGDLSSLRWLEGPLTAKTPMNKGFALIYTYYSSLNFKDIMIASGRISADSVTLDRLEHECLLGFEYSGRDLSGRRVMGIVNNWALSTLITGDKNLMWTIPETWTLEDAATVPVVYSTVIYALLSVATLKTGTSILIHSATGGIGLAAINVCLHYGCKIFVTVGTQEKRDYLKQHYPQIPDSRIGNSRNTSFVEMIKVETDGRGVDIVLNSLSEEKLKSSIRCLARGGMFLEIGKFDIANNTSLNLLLLERECSYHGVMLNSIFVHSSDIKTWLYNTLDEGMNLGFIKPLPRTVFKRVDIEKAFRYMTTGKHIGKVLVNVRDEEEEKCVKPSQMTFRGMPRFNCVSEKLYIIIGGLGGVGMELADWLMLRGAKKLIMVSPSGIKTGYQTQRIRNWKSHGVSVDIFKTNTSTREGCISLIEEAHQLGSIDGIFNLAVVLKDALFEDQTEENFRISLAPKALSTKYLDEVSRKFCPDLRYFVVFSSVSCGRGNAGQSNYGMANSIMERICEKRRQDGLPALAIQWGAIGEVGLVAKMQKENKDLVIGGTLQQKVSSCLEVLDIFLKQKHPVVASMVVAEKRNKIYESGSIAETIADVLGIKDLKTINLDTSLAELGMDSMMGVEVIQVLEKDFEVYLTTRDIRAMTFARLLEFEKEKVKIHGEKKEDGIEQGINLLLQYIPDSKVVDVVTKLSTQTQDEGKTSTVFVFPGIEGVLKPLASLTANLNARVFGVQYSYHSPEDSVEEAAKKILQHIEVHVSKNQTLSLIGYSFGVIVALEIVALLESKGYRCNFIAIEGAPAYIQSFCIDYFQSESENELQTNLLIKILELFLPKNLLLQSKEKILICDTYEERLNLVKSIVPIDFHEHLDKQAAIALYKRFRIILDYKFSHMKIKCPVNLIKAKLTMFHDIEDDYRLSEFCEQPLQISVVDGDHASILNHSDLSEIVNKLL